MPTPKVALVVISDRPADLYLNRCLMSLKRFADYPFCQKVLIRDEAHDFTASGAVNEAWSRVDSDAVLHVEEDFLLTEPLDIEAMLTVLDAEPNLASLCLLRQPWSQPEHQAGGIIPLYAEHMTDRETLGYPWVEHDCFFSLNPSLVPRRVFEGGFPEGSEPAMTERLLAQGYRFGYWGARTDPPRCLHIGELRSVGSVR